MYSFYLCLLLFLVTALLTVAFQPYVVWIPIFLIYKEKHVPDQIYIKMINSFVFLSTFYSPIRWVISSKANSVTLPSLLFVLLNYNIFLCHESERYWPILWIKFCLNSWKAQINKIIFFDCLHKLTDFIVKIKFSREIKCEYKMTKVSFVMLTPRTLTFNLTNHQNPTFFLWTPEN